MTRDIRERLATFGLTCPVRRLALNMDQVQQYGPPPNPAKVTDSRFERYVARHGEDSWELDALEPAVLVDLVREAILGVCDMDGWRDRKREQDEGRNLLAMASAQWEDLIEHLEE